MKSHLNWNNTTIEIQIIISIVRVSEHFSKMLVLSRVFNTRILDATNANHDYMRVNYTLIVVCTMFLVTGSQSKNVNHCRPTMPSIGQRWALASIGVQSLKWAYWVLWNDCLWSLAEWWLFSWVVVVPTHCHPALAENWNTATLTSDN
jgi:hypothetical protein